MCYGHRTGNTVGGSAYPWSQCTWYAYRRRVYYYHLPTGSYMGNGQDWANTGRSLGYLVNRTPHVGAAMVFRAGQLGANSRYGHVAVVERVNSDGSVLISECGASFRAWRNGARFTMLVISNTCITEFRVVFSDSSGHGPCKRVWSHDVCVDVSD